MKRNNIVPFPMKKVRDSLYPIYSIYEKPKSQPKDHTVDKPKSNGITQEDDWDPPTAA